MPSEVQLDAHYEKVIFGQEQQGLRLVTAVTPCRVWSRYFPKTSLAIVCNCMFEVPS